MELTAIVETEDECKEFIRSPRCSLCYKRQMQFSAHRYKIKHMGIHTYTIMSSKFCCYQGDLGVTLYGSLVVNMQAESREFFGNE